MQELVGCTGQRLHALEARVGSGHEGAELINTFNKTQHSYRKWCRTCGGHLFTEHPGMGLIDVYAAVIPDFPYRAGVHVNYLETKLRINDGLPKASDVPTEMGGSGVLVAE